MVAETVVAGGACTAGEGANHPQLRLQLRVVICVGVLFLTTYAAAGVRNNHVF